MSFYRSFITRASTANPCRPGRLGIRPSLTRSHPRCYATDSSSSQQGTPKWLLASIGLGIPISLYLWTRGDAPKSKINNSGNQGTARSTDNDEPRAMGAPSGPGSMSYKQEGWSNGDTMHPYVNDPGKSKKGEGETETAKLKGTVRVDRPQA